MRTLRELLDDTGVHVLDGAMGTMLYSRGVFVNVCYDELTLKQPGLVQEVHETYVRAGAEILETNTFGANPVKLSGFGLDDRTEEINRAAAELAHRAARGRALVVGAVGPLGIRIEPWGPTARTEAVAHSAARPPAWPRVGWTGSSWRRSATSRRSTRRWRPRGRRRLTCRSSRR
jgi:methionine synthase I (cobalamin-dependent)